MGADWEGILGAEGADIQDAYDDLVWRAEHPGEPATHAPEDYSDRPDDDVYLYESGWDVEAWAVVRNEDVHFFTDARNAFYETEILHLSDWDNLDVLECIAFDATPQDDGCTRIDISVGCEDYFTEERLFELRDELAPLAISGHLRAEGLNSAIDTCVCTTLYECSFGNAAAAEEGSESPFDNINTQLSCVSGDEALLVNRLPKLLVDGMGCMTEEDLIHALPHDLKQRIRAMGEDEVFADEERLAELAPAADASEAADGDAASEPSGDDPADETLATEGSEDFDGLYGLDTDDEIPF